MLPKPTHDPCTLCRVFFFAHGSAGGSLPRKQGAPSEPHTLPRAHFEVRTLPLAAAVPFEAEHAVGTAYPVVEAGQTSASAAREESGDLENIAIDADDMAALLLRSGLPPTAGARNSDGWRLRPVRKTNWEGLRQRWGLLPFGG